MKTFKTFTRTVKVKDVKFDVNLCHDDDEHYFDWIWDSGSIQEISDLLEQKVLEEIEDEAIRQAGEDIAQARIDQGEAWR